MVIFRNDFYIKVSNMKRINRLVEQCKAGDKKALAELFTLHKALISNIVNKWVSNRPSAEDVLQNIFLCVIKSIGSFKGEADISTWIYRIAQNECFRYLGKLKREREKASEEDVYYLPDPADTGGPEARTESLEIREKLGRVIEKLEPERRAVIALYYYAGMNTAEMAEALNIPPNTVYSRLKRARDDLRAMLGEMFPDGEL
jgi:RNA polymerase sigma-70 factor (ECF subfamily)